LKQIISEALKAERQKTGLSQDKLAGKAELSVRYYQAIESGAKQPSMAALFRLCISMGISYSDILQPAWEQFVKKSKTSN